MAWTEEARKKAAETRKKAAAMKAHTSAMKRRRQLAVKRQGRENGKLTGYSGKQKELDLFKSMGTMLGQIQSNYRSLKNSMGKDATSLKTIYNEKAISRAQKAPRSKTGQFISKDTAQSINKTTMALAGATLKSHAGAMKNLYDLSKRKPTLGHVTAAKAIWKSANDLKAGKTKSLESPHLSDPFWAKAGDLTGI